MADRAGRKLASCDNIEKAEKYLENGDYDEAAKEYETAVRNGGLEEDLEPKMSLNTAYITIRDMCIDADREGVVEFIDSVSFNAVKDELKKDDSIRLSSDRYLSIRDRYGIDMVIYGSLKNGRTGSAAAMISASNVNAIYEGEFSRGVPGGMGKLIIWDKSEGADKAVILTGDLNVAHQEIDLKNPKTNHRNAGFTDEERGKMTELLGAGFIDSFRHFYPDVTGAYSWWSYIGGARSRNAGWRIDYFIVSEKLRERMIDAKIHPEIMGSDHCPVELDIRAAEDDG